MNDLIVHGRGSRYATLAELQLLDEPPALGTRHRPIPHAQLISTLHVEFDRRGCTIQRERFAIDRFGDKLFGVFNLTVPQRITGPDRELSLGIRNSTNETLSIQAVAGTHIFVCDNLAFSGDTFAIRRKNTTGLELDSAITSGFDRFLQQASTLDAHITRLQETPLEDTTAKQLIYDAFASKIVPVKLFDDIDELYFRQETPDVAPRTLWGLHNAFTRAFKSLSPMRMLTINVALGRFFGMRS